MKEEAIDRLAEQYRTFSHTLRASKIAQLLRPREAVIKRLCYLTVRITNAWGETGTRFLVANPRIKRNLLARRHVPNRAGRTFLVTNKHVIWGLGSNLVGSSSEMYVDLQFNRRTGDGRNTRTSKRISLSYSNGMPRWREHPRPAVDVMVVDITDVINDGKLRTAALHRLHFADKATLRKHEIKIADEVLVIGYPSNLVRHHNNSFPIVRQGIIASDIGSKLEYVGSGTNERKAREPLPAFLIDGAIIPGSSGSPVVLKPVYGRIVENRPWKGIIPMLLLGIVAEALDVPIQSETFRGRTYAQLGIAFDAETILETIDLF